MSGLVGSPRKESAKTPARLPRAYPLARESSCVALYNMCEAGGGHLWDHSGCGNHGTITNGTWTAGALSFAGTGLVSCGSADSVDINGPFSVIAVVNAAGEGAVASKSTGVGATGTGYQIYKTATTTFAFAFYDGAGNYQYAAVSGGPNDLWYIVQAVYTGSLIVVYNKRTVGTPVAVTGYSPALSQNLTLARYSYAAVGSLTGKLAYFALFNKAFTVAETVVNYHDVRAIMASRGIVVQ